ncbi:glycosyltransferase family 4 protein [Acetobacter sp.]|uniref:glycosyltransferase family 4 protein n=1 Tax=Acetobacter sp. TaxID=440 RepID=UPI0025BA72AE|nr:glycosyltransferase family 4 protein [Acetobacter sp.]MCI1298412.1 glycosyltransferase family 4 protein [Acetobacter sp.]MCI1316367.1 glycosyltransferase family 4 protein [Acetobacter sp.]
MKILHVVRQFSPSVGGLEDSVLSLAFEQRAMGIDAQVITLNTVFNRDTGRLPPRESIQGIPVTRVPWRGSTRYPLAPTVLAHVGGADLIHVHAIDFFFDFFALTKFVVRKPLIVSTHGGFFHSGAYAKLKKLWFATLTRASVRAYDKVVACSQNDADIFADVAKGRLVTIENGINQSKFSNASSEKPLRTLISFGRFSPHKRLDRLFDLLAVLKKQNPEWKLIVAGRPAEQSVSDLEQFAVRSGVENAVQFLVEPSDEALRDALGVASWFVSFSDHEGFGLAAVEAMSAGLIPVLSEIAPFSRLVDKTGVGLQLEGEDMQGLATKIESLQTDPEAMAAGRASAIAGAQSYDWKDVARQYVGVYAEVLGMPVASSGSVS